MNDKKQERRPSAGRLMGCPGQDLNLHELPRYHLKVVRLPIPPPGRVCGELYAALATCRETSTMRFGVAVQFPPGWRRQLQETFCGRGMNMSQRKNSTSRRTFI